MNRSDFLLQLDELLELAPGSLKGDESLEGLDGWGSLAVLGYMALLNENFRLIISPAQISSCVVVNDLFDLTTDNQSTPAH
jgi:acyl carrier protein